MATYEIIYDDGIGEARIATRQRIDAAATLAWSWAYEGLGYNALRDRPIAHIGRNKLYKFERDQYGNIGANVTITTGPHGSYVRIERIA
jgi:hypothetical protein